MQVTDLFEQAPYDPADPNPWLALYLDPSLPIHDGVKRAWLEDCATPSRQWLLPLVRPVARLGIVLVQLLKFVLPRAVSSSRILHRVLARALAWFATPQANWLILRHFHIGANNLAWLNANLAGGRLELDSIRPLALDELRDDIFVRHDVNLYNFLIGLAVAREGLPIIPVPAERIDFAAIPDRGEVPVRLEDMPRGPFNVIDLATAIEFFTPVYALFLPDEDFWRATHSLQLDETIAGYAAQLTGRPEAMLYVNNRHPMVPAATHQGAFRLLLHGLATEVMHALLVRMKEEQEQAGGTSGG